MSRIIHNPDATQLVDDAIEKMEPFAKQICKKLRAIIYTAEPNIIEDWKWGPNYYYEGMVCGFWGFKKHVTFNFFQGALLKDKKKILQHNPGNLKMRHIKFTNANHIDEKVLMSYIREAVANNKKGIKVEIPKNRIIVTPSDFKKILSKNKLLQLFESMAYSHRKEYIQWIEEAKKEETRLKRIDKAIDLLSQKKGLNDKYKK